MFGPSQTPERYFLMWAKPASQLVEPVGLILTYFPSEETAISSVETAISSVETAISSVMVDPQRFISRMEK